MTFDRICLIIWFLCMNSLYCVVLHSSLVFYFRFPLVLCSAHTHTVAYHHDTAICFYRFLSNKIFLRFGWLRRNVEIEQAAWFILRTRQYISTMIGGRRISGANLHLVTTWEERGMAYLSTGSSLVTQPSLRLTAFREGQCVGVLVPSIHAPQYSFHAALFRHLAMYEQICTLPRVVLSAQCSLFRFAAIRLCSRVAEPLT